MLLRQNFDYIFIVQKISVGFLNLFDTWGQLYILLYTMNLRKKQIITYRTFSRKEIPSDIGIGRQLILTYFYCNIKQLHGMVAYFCPLHAR